MNMKFEPIKKASASEQVYEQLKDNLIMGVWKPGDKILSENEICETFQVSRTTARQAISKLVTLGLLETRRGEGNFVKERNAGEFAKEIFHYIQDIDNSLEDLLEFRIMMEVGAVGVASVKASRELMLELQESFERMEDNKEDYDKYIQEDFNFHMLIIKMTENPMIIQLACAVGEIIHASISKVTLKIGVENGLKYHKKLLEAILEKNSEKAMQIMHEHLSTLSMEYLNNSQ